MAVEDQMMGRGKVEEDWLTWTWVRASERLCECKLWVGLCAAEGLGYLGGV
jgi:hypothetical protein